MALRRGLVITAQVAEALKRPDLVGKAAEVEVVEISKKKKRYRIWVEDTLVGTLPYDPPSAPSRY